MPRNRSFERRIACLLTGVAAGAWVAGCGQPATPGTAATPPPTTAASAGGAAATREDLAFSGALAGTMSSGTGGDTYVCTSSGGSFVAGPILGSVAGGQVALNITKLGFTGPGTYPPGGVSFDAGTHHYYPATGAAGSLVVNADLQSGSVDVALAVDTDPASVVAHVTGAWRCPPGGS